MKSGPSAAVVGSLMAVVLVAAAFGLFDRRRESLVDRTQPVGRSENVVVQNNVASSLSAPQHKTAGGAHYSDLFNSSKDYLEFVRGTIEAAKSGNADAEYYLGEALSFCGTNYRANFYHNFREVSLNEALTLHPGDQREVD